MVVSYLLAFQHRKGVHFEKPPFGLSFLEGARSAAL